MFDFLKKKSPLELIQEVGQEKIYKCSCCGAKHVFYRVTISKVHVSILMRIRAYCLKNSVHEFTIKELDNELNLTKTEYGNLNVLCRFGLLYRNVTEDGHKIKGGHYGINMKRTLDFISKKGTVAEYYIRNVNEKTHELSNNRVFIDQIKGIDEKFLKENNLPNYVDYI